MTISIGANFDEARYRQVIDKLRTAVQDLRHKLNAVVPAGYRGIAMIPTYLPMAIQQAIRDAIVWLVNKIVQIVTAILNRILDYLQGALAPLTMAWFAYQWIDVKRIATGVAGQLKPEVLGVDDHWKGTAAAAYTKAMKPQSDASARIGVLADKTTTSLSICAGAGLVFYVGVAAVVAQVILTTGTGAAVAATGVGAPAGAGIVIGGLTFSWAQLAALAGLLATLLGGQIKEMISMASEAADGTAFPGGKWPNPTTRNFSDATVLDGDADWSLAY
jgi:hypothetical protein